MGKLYFIRYLDKYKLRYYDYYVGIVENIYRNILFRRRRKFNLFICELFYL